MNLPENLPGHWTSLDGYMMAKVYAAKTRDELAMPNVADLGLANALYLADGNLTLQTAAKERLRWLSVRLAIADADLAAARGLLKASLDTHRSWADKAPAVGLCSDLEKFLGVLKS